jgi:predicted GNAT family acetyltransferase
MISSAEAAALDDPIWSALRGSHRRFALGNGLAMRYPTDVAPFAALQGNSPAAFSALEELLSADDQVALFTTNRQSEFGTLEVCQTLSCVQMVASRFDAGEALSSGDADRFVRLDGEDVPQMLQLTTLTNPGPFRARTLELGTYIGIRDAGKLVAMAGERMRFGRYVEASAVCVHPAHRGKGYARFLLSTLMQQIKERGQIPFLHVLAENQGAISLYQTLGFVVRTSCQITVCRKPADTVQDRR